MKISRTNRFDKKNIIVKSEKSLLERNLGSSTKQGNSISGNSPSISLSAKGSFISSLQQELSNTPQVRVDIVEQARQDVESGQLGNEKDIQEAVTAIIIELYFHKNISCSVFYLYIVKACLRQNLY